MYQLTGDITVSGETDCLVVTADGVTIDGGGYAITATDSSRTAGMDIGAVANITVQNLVLRGWNRGIDAVGTTRLTVDNVTILDGARGVSGFSLTDAVVRDSVFAGTTDDGLFLQGDGTTVEDSIARNNLGPGITVDGDSIVVRRNQAVDNGGRGFILRTDSGGTLTAVSNTASRNGGDGFAISRAGTDSVVTDNVATENGNRDDRGLSRGMDVRGTRTIVERNVVRDNVEWGLYIGGSETYVANNTVSGNLVGIVAAGRDGTVSTNDITDNTNHGIALRGDGSTFVGNVVSRSGQYGVLLDTQRSSPSGNVFTENTFRNRVNAGFNDDPVDGNTWNGSVGDTASDGNYWGRPVESNSDGFSDRFADDDADGIVDFPHRLAPNNVDYRPLTTPPVRTPPATAPDITVTPLRLDFGDVSVGDTATRTVLVNNTGSAPLDVIDLSLSGANASEFAVDASDFLVAPSDSRPVGVTFSPTTVGLQSATLAVTSNDTDEPAVDVALAGTGTTVATPEIEVSPTAVDFGDVLVDTVTTRTVFVNNTGAAPLDVTSIALSGANASDFGVETTGFVVAPGGSQSIAVALSTDTLGPKTATLTVASNDTDESTVEVTLSATVAAAPAPDIEVSATSIAFGDVFVNESVTRTVLVNNTGTAPLDVTSIALAGANATEFSTTATAGVVPVNGTLAVAVTVTPETPGPKTATLTVVSNDTDESSVDVALSATGVPAPEPDLDVSPTELDFGDVPVSDEATQTVTLTNVGTAPLGVTEISVSGPNASAFAVDSSGGVVLQPGSTQTLLVTFNASTPGTKTATLAVTSNDTDEPSVDVSLTGRALALKADFTIDILPGSERNPIQPEQRGVTPVAILGGFDVDPAAVNVQSLRFRAADVVDAGLGASAAHDGHLEDVNGDGITDLLIHFETAQAGFEAGDTEGVVVGELDDGTQTEGRDSVTVVPPPNRGNGGDRDGRDDRRGPPANAAVRIGAPTALSGLGLPSVATPVLSGLGMYSAATPAVGFAGETLAVVTSLTGCAVIDQPGHYELGSNVFESTATVCLDIRTSDVFVDGGGHRLDGTDTSGSAGVRIDGSAVTGGISNVTVVNVSLTDWDVGVDVVDATAVTLDGFESVDNADGLLAQSATGLVVSDGDLRLNSRRGAYLQDGSDVRLTRTLVQANRDSGLRVSSVERAAITDSVFAFNERGGVQLFGAPNATVARNRFFETPTTDVIVSADGATLVDNVIGGEDFFATAVFVRNGISVTGSAATLDGNRITGRDVALDLDQRTAPFAVRDSVLADNVQGIRGVNFVDALVQNNTLERNIVGVELREAVSTLVESNTFSENGGSSTTLADGALFLYGGRGSVVRDNVVTDSRQYGIVLADGVDDTVIQDNLVTRGEFFGIHLKTDGDGRPEGWDYVQNTTLRNNTVTENVWGVSLVSPLEVTMRDNTMAGNGANFAIREHALPGGIDRTLNGGSFFWRDNPQSQADRRTPEVLERREHYDHDIGTSNTVDGRPMLYQVGGSNVTVTPADGYGFVGLVGVDRATVRDVTLSHNSMGVLLVNTSDVVVENVTTREQIHGVYVTNQSTGTVVRDSLIDGRNSDAPGDSGVFVLESPETLVTNTTFEMVTEGLSSRDIETSVAVWYRSPGTTIEKNRFHNSSGAAVQAIYGEDVTVVANDVVLASPGAEADVFVAQATQGLVVADNRIESTGPTSSVTGIRLQSVAPNGAFTPRLLTDALVENNTAVGPIDSGISVFLNDATVQDANVSVVGNTIVDADLGISLREGAGMYVANNRVARTNAGIVIDEVDASVVERNVIDRSRSVGISVDIRSMSFGSAPPLPPPVVVRGNDVGESGRYGITVTASSSILLGQAEVLGNRVTDTGVGSFDPERSVGIRLFNHDPGQRVADNVVVNSTGSGLVFESRTRNAVAVNNTVLNASVAALQSSRDSTDNLAIDLHTDGPTITASGTNYEVQPTTAPAPAPTGLESVEAYVAVREPIAFSQLTPELELSLHYDQTDATGIDETTLSVYRYDGTQWVALASTPDPSTNQVTVSLSATEFGHLGVFGEAGTTPTGDITVTPTSLSFGTSEVGTVATLPVTVENNGTADLVVNDQTIAGTAADDFSIVGGATSFTLAPGETRDLTVQFVPSSATLREATLTLTSDDPTTPTLDVPLSGTGTLPADTVQVSLVPTTETVAPGETVTVDAVLDAGTAAVYAAQASVEYDAVAVDISRGSYLTADGAGSFVTAENATDSLGRADYGESRTGPLPTTGSGTLATLTVAVPTDVTTSSLTLTLTDVVVVDETATPVAVILVDTTLTVASSTGTATMQPSDSETTEVTP
ncbi:MULTISPECIES: choice-of-anchor D domain-containing protein [Salinibaculum]|uniref:choice-of-anchor D domain-containing protein n=1 Tax=Salinibaculum TaxID=2732368 RepID=UPI0030CEA36A